MVFVKSIKLSILFFSFFVGVYLYGEKNNIQSIKIDSSFSKILLGNKLYYFEDKSTKLSLEDIMKKRNQFIQSTKKNPGFGYTNSAYWVKFTLENITDSTVSFYLENKYAIVDIIDLYSPQLKDGSVIYTKKRLGIMQKFSQRDVQYRTLIFLLKIKAHQNNTYYMRIKNTASMNLYFTLWSPSKFFEHTRILELFLGVFYGIMVVMFFYNFFLLVSTRDINYLYYIFWILGATMVQMSLNGYSFEYFWSESFWWNKANIPFFMTFGGFWGLHFARVFLETKDRMKKMDNFLIGFSILFVIVMLATFVLPYYYVIKVATYLWIIMPITMLTVTAISLKSGYKPARFFLIGWSSAFLGTGLFAAKTLALLSSSFLTNWGMQIGVALEVVLISLGLGDRINQLKRDKEKAQGLLLETKSNMLESFARFVPQQFLTFLDKESIEDIHLGDSTSKSMSILFSDIRNFTNLSESMSSDDIFRFLNSYLKRMEPIIQKYNGFVDKFIGDAIMALFDGLPDEALRAAIEMRKELVDYNIHRSNMGYASIEIGTGMHTGDLMLGTVGSSRRLDTTVIGDTVNTAARLESLTKLYQVPLIISDGMYDLLTNKENFHIRLIDMVKVKGKDKPTYLYEVYDHEHEDIIAKKKSLSDVLNNAYALYRKGNFNEALVEYKKLKKEMPLDPIYDIYIKRCEYLIKHPPSKNWKGLSKINRK